MCVGSNVYPVKTKCTVWLDIVSNCKSRNTFLRACRETERRRFFFDTQNSSRSEWQLFPSSIHAVIPTIRFVPRHNWVLNFIKFDGVPQLRGFHHLFRLGQFLPTQFFAFTSMRLSTLTHWNERTAITYSCRDFNQIKFLKNSLHGVE